MLPRLASPQFGLLDDATNIYAVKELQKGDPAWVQGLNSGRFRPTYFLFFALIYMIGGKAPTTYFIVNSIIFMLTTASLVFLVNKLTRSPFVAWWSGTLFVLSSPVIENFYTILKPEPSQALAIITAIVALSFIEKPSKLSKKILILSTSLLLILFAMLMKETSIVIVPISTAWYLVGLIFQRFSGTNAHLPFKRNFMIITLCSSVIFITLWYVSKQDVIAMEGLHYKYSFETSDILKSVKEWERWIRRDFFFLYFLIAPPLLWLIHKRRFPLDILFSDALIWMLGWLVVFVPWVYQLDYYLLPFTLGSSVLGAICIKQNIQIYQTGSVRYRIITVISLCLAAFFFITTLPNNLTNARLQLTVDKRNADLIAFVSNELPQNAILFINIQQPSEYLGTISRSINEIYGRSDIQIRQLDPENLGLEDTDAYQFYIASPVFINQFYRSVRLGFSADGANKWNDSISTYLNGRQKLVFESLGKFQLFLVEIRLGCFVRRVPGYCDISTIPLDRRELTYGWKVYRIPIQH